MRVAVAGLNRLRSAAALATTVHSAKVYYIGCSMSSDHRAELNDCSRSQAAVGDDSVLQSVKLVSVH